MPSALCDEGRVGLSLFACLPAVVGEKKHEVILFEASFVTEDVHAQAWHEFV